MTKWQKAYDNLCIFIAVRFPPWRLIGCSLKDIRNDIEMRNLNPFLFLLVIKQMYLQLEPTGSPEVPLE